MAIENVNNFEERRSKIVKTGFSIVICRPIGNRKHRFLRLLSAFVDCYERFQLPLNTARALCIARCRSVFKLWVNNSSEENYISNCRYLASGTGFTNSLLFIGYLLDSNAWIYHSARQVCEFEKKNHFLFPLGTQKNRLNETFLLRIKTCK